MHAEFPLSEIAQVNPGRPRLSLEPQTEVSFIPMSDVTDSGRWDNRQVRKYQDVRKGYTCFENRDVLFAKITPCMENGKGCLVDGVENNVGFGSTEFHVLRAKANADPGFIYQWSIHRPLRLKAAASMTGSAGQQRVPASFFEAFMIPQMNKAEQTKIAEILSTVDQAIEHTEALIAKQQRIKTGLIENLLTRGIDEQGNLRSEETHRFKDSPLGRIPVEWEVNSLGSILRQTGAVLRTGPFGSQLHAQEYVTEGVPVVMPQNIADGNVQLEMIARVTEAKAQSMAQYRLHDNDIVFSRRGDLSRATAIGVHGRGWLCGTGCFMLRVPARLVEPRWLAAMYRFGLVQRQVAARAVGSTMPSLNSTVMGSLLLPLPEYEEQQEIANRASTAELAVESGFAHYRKLRSLKTALMQDLLTGRVRVTPLLNDTEVIGE